MKIKSLLLLFSISASQIFTSCNDNLNEIGETIQPPNDTIAIKADTVTINAKTVSMSDSIYARTTQGVLGKYDDDMFGSIKSDYICQFFFPDNLKFKDNFKQIDSARLVIDFNGYTGNVDIPMGLSIYEVTKTLPENFYTNIDPLNYTDLKTVLAKEAYTIAGSKKYSNSNLRSIVANLGPDFGKRIYNAWKNGTIKDNDSFNKFFKGMYITTDFGNSSLIKVASTSIDIFYKHQYKDTLGVMRDTTAALTLSVTPEVLQLNHIKNSNPDELFVGGTGATYLKTPAGVYTEVVLPIAQITANMEKKNMSLVNSALFSVKGYTEKESNPSAKENISRPDRLLLIEKDSVDSFFRHRRLTDGTTSVLSDRRSVTTNTYNFKNIAGLIRSYKKKKIDNPVFIIIPVATEYIPISQSTQKLIGIYNYMQPSTAILRSDPQNMKLELVYSKF